MKGKQCMTLHYHMYGEGIGSLAVKTVDIRTNYRKTIWHRSGDQGENWVRAHVNIHSSIYKVC